VAAAAGAGPGRRLGYECTGTSMRRVAGRCRIRLKSEFANHNTNVIVSVGR
jgi:hypothetical protein